MVTMGGDGGSIRMGDLAAHPNGDAVISGGGSTMIAMREGPGAPPNEPETRPIDVVSLTGNQASTRVLAAGWQPPRTPPTQLQGRASRLQSAARLRWLRHARSLPSRRPCHRYA
jgi:hypothetical protein